MVQVLGPGPRGGRGLDQASFLHGRSSPLPQLAIPQRPHLAYSPFQPLPLQEAVKVHAVQVLEEWLSTQVVVDRPGPQGTEGQALHSAATTWAHAFPAFGNAPQAPGPDVVLLATG